MVILRWLFYFFVMIGFGWLVKSQVTNDEILTSFLISGIAAFVTELLDDRPKTKV